MIVYTLNKLLFLKNHGSCLCVSLFLALIIPVLYSYDTDAWLMLFIFDLSSILAGAGAALFIGLPGFVVISGTSGLLFAIILSLNFDRFFVRGEVATAELGYLFKFPGLPHGITLYVDSVGYSFALLTSLIGSCVFLYAFSYMRFEKNTLNFLIYLKLFG